MKRLFQRGTTFAVLLCALVLLVVLQVVSFFYPPIVTHLENLHIHELLILACLIELYYSRLTAHEEDQPFVERSESLQYQRFEARLHPRGLSSFDIMSAGLSSRYQQIQSFLKYRVPVRVLVQNENTALDKVDTKRLDSFLDLIRRSVPDEASKYLEVKTTKRIVTTRSLIAHHDNSNHDIALVSWYVYDEAGAIIGHKNPSLLARSSNAAEKCLIEFASEQFDQAWELGETHHLPSRDKSVIKSDNPDGSIKDA